MRRAAVWAFETLALGLLAAIVLVVLLQVVGRYLLRISLPWPEELARFLLVWLTFAGAVVGTWHDAHFRVDVLATRLPPGAARALSVAVDALVCATLAVFVWQSFELVGMAGFMRSASMELSMSWVYGVLPAGGLCMLGWFARQLARHAMAAGPPPSEGRS
jgi:TRAP-type C4-dicarboxylate transport system permease small subunit